MMTFQLVCLLGGLLAATVCVWIWIDDVPAQEDPGSLRGRKLHQRGGRQTLAGKAAPGTRSRGCSSGSANASRAGEWIGAQGLMTDEGERSFGYYIPEASAPQGGWPIVLSFHGWGGTTLEDACDSGLVAEAARTQEFIVVHPQGLADTLQGCQVATPDCVTFHACRKGSNGSEGPCGAFPHEVPTCLGSWHVLGSTQNHGRSCNPGVQQEMSENAVCPMPPENGWLTESCECTLGFPPVWGSSTGAGNTVCYESNPSCSACDWTTGMDDVAFTDSILDWFEDNFCIDLGRVFVTGESTGGMMTYRLAAERSSRIAAIAPTAGTFIYGFDATPEYTVPVFDIHGISDCTVPAGGNCVTKVPPNMPDPEHPDRATSSRAFYYWSRNHTFSRWAESNNCIAERHRFPTPFDDINGLVCTSDCSNDALIWCEWDGGHNYFNNFGGGAAAGGHSHWTCDPMSATYPSQSMDPANINSTNYKHGELLWWWFKRSSGL